MSAARTAPPGGLPVPSERGPRWSRQVGRFLAHVVWDTEVIGAEHVPLTGPVIISANHIGLMDGPLVHGTVPRGTHILVKDEMFRGPVGTVLRAAGQIPVDRHGGRPALAAGLGVLRRGGAVGIFPEGVRGRGDGNEARAGVAWLAVNSGAPVVPTAVLGTRRTGEGVGHVPGLRRRLVVAFAEPVELHRAPGVSGRQAVADAHELLRVTLADHVRTVVERTGLALPQDAPLEDA
jgi:1-acyl-sn-glycerol-3-phosphate acyltransferase